MVQTRQWAHGPLRHRKQFLGVFYSLKEFESNLTPSIGVVWTWGHVHTWCGPSVYLSIQGSLTFETTAQVLVPSIIDWGAFASLQTPSTLWCATSRSGPKCVRKLTVASVSAPWLKWRFQLWEEAGPPKFEDSSDTCFIVMVFPSFWFILQTQQTLVSWIFGKTKKQWMTAYLRQESGVSIV